MKKIAFYVVVVLVAVFALRKVLFVPGIIGHSWDWGVPNFPEQFKIQTKASFSIWDDRLYGGFFFPFKLELPYWLFTLLFSPLGGDVLSKIIPLLIFVIAGISTFVAVRKIFSLDYFWALMSAILYMLSPFVYSRLIGGHLTILLGYAFLPLIFYFSVSLFDSLTQEKLFRSWWPRLVFLTLLLTLGILHPLMLVVSWGVIFLTAGIYFVFRGGEKRKIIKKLLLLIIFWALINSYWLLPIVSQVIWGGDGLAARPWQAIAEELSFRLPYFSGVSRPLSELFSFSFPFGLSTEFAYPLSDFIRPFFVFSSIILFAASLAAFYLAYKGRKEYLPVVLILIFVELTGIVLVGGEKTIIGHLFFLILIRFAPFIFSGFSNPLRFLPLVIFPFSILSFISFTIFEEKLRRFGEVKTFLRVFMLFALLVFFYPWFFRSLTTPIFKDSSQPMSLRVTKINPEDKEIFDFLKESEGDFRVTYLPPAFISWPGKTDLSYCWNTIYSSKPVFLERSQPVLAGEIINSLYSQDSSKDLSKLLGLASVKIIIYPHYRQFTETYQGFISGIVDYKPFFDRNWNKQKRIEKKATDFSTVDIYENENFIPHIYVPKQATFIGEETSLLSDIVAFPDYQLRNAIFFSEKEKSKTTLALNMTDNIYVKPRYIGGFTAFPQISNEEIHPVIRLLPTSPLYAYIQFKERRLWQRVEDYPKVRANTALIFMSKRLSELKMMVELQKNTQEAERKTVERYRELLTDFSEQLGKLIGEEQIDNDLLMKSWIFFDDHQKNFNFIIQKAQSADVVSGVKEIFDQIDQILPKIERNVWVTKKEEEKKYFLDIPEEGDYLFFISPEIGAKLDFEIDNKLYTREGKILDSDWVSLGEVNLDQGRHYLKINLNEQPNLFSGIATSSAVKTVSPEEPGYSYQFFAQKDNQVINAHLTGLNDQEEYKVSFKYKVIGNSLRFTFEQANDKDIRGLIYHKIDRFLPMEDRWMRFEAIVAPNFGSKEADLKFYLTADENEADTYFISEIEIKQLLSPKVIFKKEKKAEASQTPKIAYTKINPNRYTINIEGATDPYFLIFSETFNQGWRAYLSEEQSEDNQIIASYFNGEVKEREHKNILLDRGIFSNFFKKPLPEENHLSVNAFANAWYLDKPGDYMITLEFVPQRVYVVGLAISFMSLVCLLGFLGIHLLHRLQGERVDVSTMSRRSAEGGVAQPRMKNPPASVLGEASIKQRKK